MSNSTWLLNGYDLDTALGLRLGRATQWRVATAIRRSPLVMPGAHGSLSSGRPIFDDTVATAEAWVLASSQDELEEKLNHFEALAVQTALTLTRTSGSLTTSAAVDLVSVTHSDYVTRTSSRVTVLFAVPGVFFRAAPWTSSDLAFTSSLTNTELTGLSGSTGPIGDAVIRITGPATSVSVDDPMTGTGISWSGTLNAGQYLFLRARPLSGRISSTATDWSSGGSDVSGAVSFPAAGRLQLWPVVQSATVRKILMSATGTGRSTATKLAVQGQGAYL